MIPTAKSVSAPTSQVLNALSDFSFFIFRFLLLIFLSPPYKYIIPYGARYVNSFSKKYKGNKKKILLPSYLSSVFFSHHNHNIKSTEQNEHFQFFNVFLYIFRPSYDIRLPCTLFPSVLQLSSNSFCQYI